MQLGSSCKKEKECPFTNQSVLKAYNEEVHFFLHCHVRGYDRTGEGFHMDADYYDKYGAPVQKEQAWMDGYHSIELEISKHFNQCTNPKNDFPLVAGLAGGAHLYRPVGHDSEPWNRTGWVPRKKLWCSEKEFHSNRHFLNIRGNEIQNNLWDYHPFQEQDPDHDQLYEQITPLDKFQGGYWLYNQPWGRYIHIIALKSHAKVLGICYRYNSIVHPLAYRSSLNDIPDNSVDGVQWSCLNIKYDGNFDDPTKWGTDVHGIEIFNDFTYYYSWQCQHGIGCHNGAALLYDEDEVVLEKPKYRYVYWFNTYPLEFGEFLLETCLERGVYLHAIAANDAFYMRDVVPPYENTYLMTEESRNEFEVGERCLLSDPKGHMLKQLPCRPIVPPGDYSRRFKQLDLDAKKGDKDCKTSRDFLKKRPYSIDTVFGHTTLIDTFLELRNTMMNMRPGADNIESGEMTTINWLIDGKFFSHTGVYNLFHYADKLKQSIPIMIEGQRDKQRMCYWMENLDLKFTFPQCQSVAEKLIWRYTLQYTADPKKGFPVTTVQGYFKMNEENETILDLTDAYDKKNIKWIQFSALRPENPQRRVWFNPIRGLAFGDPQPNVDRSEGRTHKIASLKEEKIKIGNGEEVSVFTEKQEAFKPHPCKLKKTLEFLFPKSDPKKPDQYEMVYVYNMQVLPYQPSETKGTANSARKEDGTMLLPPRMLQNVNGYFKINDNYPTKLNLGYEWDPSTVRDNTVYFYGINPDTCQPQAIDFKIDVDMPKGYEMPENEIYSP